MMDPYVRNNIKTYALLAGKPISEEEFNNASNALAKHIITEFIIRDELPTADWVIIEDRNSVITSFGLPTFAWSGTFADGFIIIGLGKNYSTYEGADYSDVFKSIAGNAMGAISVGLAAVNLTASELADMYAGLTTINEIHNKNAQVRNLPIGNNMFISNGENGLSFFRDNGNFANVLSITNFNIAQINTPKESWSIADGVSTATIKKYDSQSNDVMEIVVSYDPNGTNKKWTIEPNNPELLAADAKAASDKFFANLSPGLEEQIIKIALQPLTYATDGLNFAPELVDFIGDTPELNYNIEFKTVPAGINSLTGQYEAEHKEFHYEAKDGNGNLIHINSDGSYGVVSGDVKIIKRPNGTVEVKLENALIQPNEIGSIFGSTIGKSIDASSLMKAAGFVVYRNSLIDNMFLI